MAEASGTALSLSNRCSLNTPARRGVVTPGSLSRATGAATGGAAPPGMAWTVAAGSGHDPLIQRRFLGQGNVSTGRGGAALLADRDFADEPEAGGRHRVRWQNDKSCVRVDLTRSHVHSYSGRMTNTADGPQGRTAAHLDRHREPHRDAQPDLRRGRDGQGSPARGRTRIRRRPAHRRLQPSRRPDRGLRVSGRPAPLAVRTGRSRPGPPRRLGE